MGVILVQNYKAKLKFVRESNQNVETAYTEYGKMKLESCEEEQIERILTSQSLTNEEFIYLLALLRIDGLGAGAGNAVNAALGFIVEDYASTPWKFVEEFLQNADDCTYASEPEIKIIVNEKSTNDNPTIEFVYNEVGFSKKDIWALTQFANSNKKEDLSDTYDWEKVKKFSLPTNAEGLVYNEKTGRKGIGFKSVFALPADDVKIHIRSNGFSFMLAKSYDAIVPVWEEDVCNDGYTHVTVELVNPKDSFKINEIYPHFKELFCISTVEKTFQENPILFMHRIKKLRVENLSFSGNSFFETSLLYSDATVEYGTSIDSNDRVLSAVCHNGSIVDFEWANMTINICDDKGQDKHVECVRYTKSINVEGYWRVFSIIAPILTSNKNEWCGGGLFRTFPVLNHEYKMPIAIDAPYELNSSRQGVDYNKNRFNSIVSKLLFGKDGVFETFMHRLKHIEDIYIDLYFDRNNNTIFDDTNNKTSFEIIDLNCLLEQYELFPSFIDEKTYLSYKELICVESEFFSWPETEDLMQRLLGDRLNWLVANKYMKSRYLLSKRNSVFDTTFCHKLNGYLDYMDNKFGAESQEFIGFLENCLYPFVKENAEVINNCNGFEEIKMYVYRCWKNGSEVIVRSSKDSQQIWIEGASHKVSVGKYILVESLIASIESIYDVIKIFNHIILIDEEFNVTNLMKKETNKEVDDWESARQVIEAALYYGCSLDGVKFDCLDDYVLSDSIDGEYNPYRDMKLRKVISSDDIQEISELCNLSVEEILVSLKEIGIRRGNDFFIIVGGFLRFNEPTIELLNAITPELTSKCMQEIHRVADSKNLTIDIDYNQVINANELVNLYFLKNRRMVATESYTAFCENCLSDETLWKKGTDESVDIILRALKRARKTDYPNLGMLSISLQYLISNADLPEYYMKAVENNGFDKVISIKNNGCFSAIQKEEIMGTIQLYAEERVGQEQINSFYSGKILANNRKGQNYLLDVINHAVYLDEDEDGDILEALSKYLKKDFDVKKTEIEKEFRKITADVYERIIAPTLTQVGHNYTKAYEEIEEDFDKYSKKEIVNIIAWFRRRGSDEVLGGGTVGIQNAIRNSYKEEPWRFVYEFMQNVDDCVYEDETSPKLDIQIDNIRNSISFEYNEAGFSLADLKALTSFGQSKKTDILEKRSIKTGLFNLEKTGRKGLGFKSVFALPGKNIVVHVCSNGFNFKFIKNFGEIIPIWEDVNDAPMVGTRIIVEGFEGKSISNIYSELMKLVCAEEHAELFAKSPLLYLRKLNMVKISNNSSSYELSILEHDREYSDENFFVPQNTRVVSGIVCDDLYKNNYTSMLDIEIKMTGKRDISINALKYATMRIVNGDEQFPEARLISLVAPIITEDNTGEYSRGSLYTTLPLNENRFNLPISINAPFELNDGRSALFDGRDIKNNGLIKMIFGEIIQSFYLKLREIPNIEMENYVFEKDASDATLFSNMTYVEAVDLCEITRNIPVLSLLSGNGYVSCAQAIVLSRETYKWLDPTFLAKVFSDDDSDRLVLEKYISNKLSITRLDMINTEFHAHINRYIKHVHSNEDSFWMFLSDSIYPYLDKNMESLIRRYRVNNEENLLKEMCIFSFTDYKDEKHLESANVGSVWLTGCPKNCKSYKHFRSLENAPVVYKKESLVWMKQLLDVIAFEDAFNEKNLRLSEVTNIDALKAWLEIFIYYRVKPTFKIPYLAKCVFSSVIAPQKNIFRKAFLESNDRNILESCIDMPDIESIVSELNGIVETDSESIVELIKQLGIKEDDDYFEVDNRGIVKFKSETLALFKKYCKDNDKSEECLLEIKDKYDELSRLNKRIHLVVGYEDIQECKPLFVSMFLKMSILGGDEAAKLAREVFCESKALIKTEDFEEMMIVSLSLIDREIDESKKINIKLSSVIERRIASYLRRAMANKYGANVLVNLEKDIPTCIYESKEVKKSLSWLQSSDSDNAIEIESFKYYTANIKDGFTLDEEAYYLFDSESVVLDSEEVSNNLLEFVRAKYSSQTDGELLSGLIKIVSIQNELTENWKKSKQEYVARLAEFREETQKYIQFLCPDYQTNINQATGKNVEYMIPELLQNINDCRSEVNGDERHLEIILNQNSMVLRYNERGFDFSDVYSITAYGKSTKHDEREGEKGLGFKKVFAVFPSVEIYSNEFFFELRKEKATVPVWIEDIKSQEMNYKPGYTTMVFKYENDGFFNMQKIQKIWKDAILYPQKAGPFLALRNIAMYRLQDDNQEYNLDREDMLDCYYQAEVPLLLAYEKQLSGVAPASVVSDRMNGIKAELRKRKKCLFMSDEDFEKYISNLSLSVYIPRESINETGMMYSTLPTVKNTETGMYIDMPVELTTGRDDVLENSDFNEAIWMMVFDRGDNKFSVLNYIYGSLMHSYNDLDLYQYFNKGIDAYIRMISKGNESKYAMYRKELDELPLLRDYSTGKPIPLSSGYTVEPIVYEYIYSNIDEKQSFDYWFRSKHPDYSDKHLISLRKGNLEEIEHIHRFANEIGEDKNRFPIVLGDEYMTISYFEDEYGTIGGEHIE